MLASAPESTPASTRASIPASTWASFIEPNRPMSCDLFGQGIFPEKQYPATPARQVRAGNHMDPGADTKHLILYDGICGLCDRFIRFVLPRAKGPGLLVKASAALFVFGRLGWPWKVTLVLRLLPLRLLDWGYARIAKSRYKIFGRYETCLMPSPAYRDRFVDT